MSRKKNDIYRSWDGCTSGGEGGVWKRGTTDSNEPSAWPGSCWRFFKEDEDPYPTPNAPLINATCQYPSGTIPRRNQAAVLASAAQGTSGTQRAGTAQLLTNYCFQPIQDSDHLPSGMISAPKTLSTHTRDKDICKKYKHIFPSEYDTGAEEYCTSVYDRHKDDTGFDFRTTGCQCWVDSRINPPAGLETVLASHFGIPPSCIWQPCLPSSNQILPIGQNGQKVNEDGIWRTECPNIPTCSNLFTLTEAVGSEIDQSIFSQPINCSDPCHRNSDCEDNQSCNTNGMCVTSCKNVECKSGEVCSDDSGLCVPAGEAAKTKTKTTTKTMWIIIVVVLVVVGGLGGLIWWVMTPKRQIWKAEARKI